MLRVENRCSFLVHSVIQTCLSQLSKNLVNQNKTSPVCSVKPFLDMHNQKDHSEEHLAAALVVRLPISKIDHHCKWSGKEIKAKDIHLFKTKLLWSRCPIL